MGRVSVYHPQGFSASKCVTLSKALYISEGMFDDAVEGRLCLPATLFSLNCRDTWELRPAAASPGMELVLPERTARNRRDNNCATQQASATWARPALTKIGLSRTAVHETNSQLWVAFPIASVALLPCLPAS